MTLIVKNININTKKCTRKLRFNNVASYEISQDIKGLRRLIIIYFEPEKEKYNCYIEALTFQERIKISCTEEVL